MRPSRPALVVLILLALLATVFAPRVIGGYADAGRGDALLADRPLEAAQYYESAAARLPWRGDLWEKAGLAALSGGDAQLATALLETARQRGALSDPGLLGLGDAYVQQGDEDTAWRLWSAMAQDGRTSSGLYRRLAPMQERRGLYDPQAAQSWRSLIALEPGDAQAHYRVGLILVSSDPQAGLPELTRAAGLDPSLYASVRMLRTEINKGLIETDAAYRLLVTGRALGSAGEWPLALRAFENAVRQNQDYAEAWAWMGEAAQHLGIDRAREFLDYALALDPASAGIRGLDGLYWQRHEQPQKALAAFAEALRLDPHNPAWHASSGDVKTDLADLPGALASYEKAVDLAPQDPAYWRLLALFCADHDTQIAETGLHAAFAALQLEPDNPVNLDVLGRLLLEAGYNASAETILLRAVAAAPQSASPEYHLGLLYLNEGRTQVAYDRLVRAQSLDPGGPIGAQATRVLERYFLP